MDLRWALDEAIEGLHSQDLLGLRVPAPTWEALRRSFGETDECSAVSYRGVRCEPSASAQLEVVLRPQTLQAMLGPREGEPAALYVRGEALTAPDGALVTGGPASLSMNTFVNSFYEAYWLEHTRIRSLGLSFRGRGRFWCDVFRETPQGGERLLRAWVNLEEGRQVTLPIDLAAAGEGGRLYAELQTEGPVRIHPAWTTSVAPRNAVSLGVGVCTFNREDSVAAMLEALLAPGGPDVRRIVLVNQGTPIASPALMSIVERHAPRLQVVEQANHGGSGGFASAAMHLTEHGDCTHVAFMDDDVELDARHLGAALAFLGHAERPLVLGGQMLDRQDRACLFEAGACIEGGRVLPNHRETDLTDPESLRLLSRAAPSDFNGWWMAIIPVECFHRQGLPLPLFIHVDDAEFGVRLTEAGIPTVSLPPISVWHERYSAKPPGLYSYYDVRNWAIFSSLHPTRYPLLPPASLAKQMVGMLLRYDYSELACLNLGLRDFLRGPPTLDEPAPRLHARVASALADTRVRLEPDGSHLPLAAAEPAEAGSRKRGRLLGSLARVLCGAPRRNGVGPVCLARPQMPLDLMALGRSYVLTDVEDRFFIRRDYCLRRTWQAAVSASVLVARYAVRRSSAARAWRDAHARLCSREAWTSRLAPT